MSGIRTTVLFADMFTEWKIPVTDVSITLTYTVDVHM
jgi:hypothetical protein